MISEKRYRIELETIEPLRIGGVEDPLTGIHNPVARVGDKVVVPGSSLKGALRAEIERFLIDTYYNKTTQTWPADKLAFQPCIPATRFSSDEQALIISKKYKDNACHYPCEFEERRDRKGEFFGKCTEAGKIVSHTICPACYFLGAMGLNGFVHVPFLYAQVSPEELYSARMDRAKGTVVEGTNRPYQLIRAGVNFSGTLVIIIEDTLTGWKIGQARPLKDKGQGDKWLEAKSYQPDEIINMFVLERLTNIQMLGGYKSKGFGQVKINVTPL